jgi:penicillin G amidase
MKLKYVMAACAALILAPLALVHGILRASLPKLDGEAHNMGIVATVTIDRDALGIPTIEAANRVDLAYGTGFVHGQDRFFQMDLSRRLAAGQLSELFGEVAVEQDKKARIFRFRQVALDALKQGTPEQRAVLEAYARGVNAGLASLRSRPWEYWVLRSVPQEWRPEDTVLVSHAMWWDLQYGGLRREMLRQEINARLGGAECEGGWKCGLQFLYPARTQWDAPNAPVGVVNAGPVGGADAEGAGGGEHGGDAAPGTASPAMGGGDPSNVPPPDVLDVRGRSANDVSAPAVFAAPVRTAVDELKDLGLDDSNAMGIGSNNWAVAGRLTTTGSALVANDMHLTARVPIVWYRARMRIRDSSTQPGVDLNGVTLPGAPLLVAGSNGHIAWGFTNSYGQWYRVQKVPCISVGEDSIQTAGGPLALTVQQEEIRVHGKPSVLFPVKSAAAGVLFEAHPDKQACWFVNWLAQQPAATNMNLMALEHAASVTQALAIAPTLGIPHQNFVVGDKDGHIGWAIAGRVPVDNGATRANGASPWTTPESHPHIVDPEAGRIWTANARATDDPAQLALIGGDDVAVGADYDFAARVRQIRDDLLGMQGPAAPGDMLRIQLDDRAVFLTRWQALLTSLLDADAVANQPRRAQFKRLVADWNARASVDSVGYRLVRAYHERLERETWKMLLVALRVESQEDSEVPSQFEPALWRLVNERPLHMLAANYGDWRQFLLEQVDATIAGLQETCPELARCSWGAHKLVRVRHPLSGSLPFLSRLLDMPAVELPGDHDMPRVQDGTIGASERFAVSPGHEEQGYLHMPGGQSGHPLSPYYRAGFMDWANGTPVPFLPGASQHRLTLQPD